MRLMHPSGTNQTQSSDRSDGQRLDQQDDSSFPKTGFDEEEMRRFDRVFDLCHTALDRTQDAAEVIAEGACKLSKVWIVRFLFGISCGLFVMFAAVWLILRLLGW